jgi:hypothetical protein
MRLPRVQRSKMATQGLAVAGAAAMAYDAATAQNAAHLLDQGNSDALRANPALSDELN